MRFAAPRSLSPSPERQSGKRRSFSYGIHSDSEDDDDDDDDVCDTDVASIPESESDSDESVSEPEVLRSEPRHKRILRTPEERRQIEDTVAAIRLRTRHHDLYDEWERQTRRDAFKTARKEQAELRSQLRVQRNQSRELQKQQIAEAQARQVAEVQARLGQLRVAQEAEEIKIREEWKLRDKKLWERIEDVIKFEEDKVRAKLEAERKQKEAEEKKRRDEELKRRLAEEKRKEEEERQRKEEEERKRKEEEDKQKHLKEEQERTERLQAEQAQRQALGLTTAEDDYYTACDTLQSLKSGPMKSVKSDKQRRAAWSAIRRQIVPKVGQLTNDPDSILRISTQLWNIIMPDGGLPEDIYLASLSSLAKAILLQAETEVTAEKRSAAPLALVATNLLSSLPHFPKIFFAKLVQRAGGWPVPAVVPTAADFSGKPWPDESARVRAMGYRKASDGSDVESPAEYTPRVAGLMRVYFHILKAPPVGNQPMERMFQLPRAWIWFARMMGQRGLLETAVAPELLYVGLEVLGHEANEIWGQQWVKMLALLYEGVTVGLGDGDMFIGGRSSEGNAARVRVQLEVERIMTGVP